MQTLRLKNTSVNIDGKGTIYLHDCGLRCDFASDQVIKGSQQVLASIGGGIARRFIELNHIKVYVLYHKAWLPVDFNEVQIVQNAKDIWEIKIKQYDIIG